MTVKSFAFLLIFSTGLHLAGCKQEAQDPRSQPPLDCITMSAPRPE
jgi:hypothetical protein